ncbi:hydrogenase nickel incorporation protein HypB [Flexibacter flexilis DSM 6793]|uniref:Hydrogenase nickel incorporation protein HypB n=1 Tax=Flexibacter flexilis DSM 6793 TaxID=927664 RepID=A0A1I1IEZ6_9BACT|nr:hydrogenase nickel incorporation protein HypB [Flexibacter flexilis]SFC31780.1 hydrogenase nickel incorporation protein HypB [Flexibacter flexilis DSM 6793]
MCTTCGCSSTQNGITYHKIDAHAHGQDGHHHDHDHAHGEHHHHHDHEHPHDHSNGHHHHHGHEHTHDHSHSHDGHHHDHDHAHTHHHHGHEVNIVELEKDILHKNQLSAERNRGYFEALNIFCLNLVSSPGSGKTSFLEKTIGDLKGKVAFSVIEGDQQTSNDALRIHNLNVPVVQINTGKGCHLDSDMVATAVKQLKPAQNSVLMVENVGNLVCPAMFDLGEASRVVVISVTEGEDKPLKYPDMFYSSQVCIINKIDLLPYLKFDLEKLKESALKVNPRLKFFEVSATTGEGMEAWYEFLQQSLNK